MVKVTKKITKKAITQPKVVEEVKLEQELKRPEVSQEEVKTDSGEVKKVKRCQFCQNKTNPSYTDTVALRRFMSDRAKIVSRLRTGVCSKHQRKLSKEIKYARHLALLPFVPSV